MEIIAEIIFQLLYFESKMHPYAIAVLLFSLSVVQGVCICNNGSQPAAGYPPFSANAPALQNPALDVASLTMHLLRRYKVRVHKFAMVCAAMYDMYASFALNSSSTLVNLTPCPPDNVSLGKRVGYAGYAALVDLLKDQPDELALLHARMSKLGYDKPGRNERVEAVLRKYALQGGKYTPTNPLENVDASCAALRSADKWQRPVRSKNTKYGVRSSKAGSAAFLNASMVSLDGTYDVKQFISRRSEPPQFR